MDYKKTSKDRWDAKRVPLTALMQCAIDLKPGRLENEVYIDNELDVTELCEYLKEKDAIGEHYTFFYAFLSAIGKVIYNRPKMNRFVANRHLYEHDEVTLAFVAKISLDDKSEELMLVVSIDPDDTIATIKEKVSAKINKLRDKSGSGYEKKGSNSAIDTLAKLPNPIRVPIMGMFKFLDKRGKIPASIVADNVYYSSMIVSNLGSIHCGAIYHNLANFGTSSSLATLGEVKPKKIMQADGSEITRQVCEFGITIDERIADGFYFAKTNTYIQYVLNHPQLLEEPANAKIDIS